MKKLTMVILCLMMVLAFSGPTLAQLKYGTDYTTSDTVLNVTNVKVDSNRVPHYLEGLKQTWMTACEVWVELDHMMECEIYVSILDNSGDYNVMLIQKYRDLAQQDESRKSFKEFDKAWLEKISEEKRREVVDSYPDIRTIVGEYLMRKVEFLGKSAEADPKGD